MSDDRQLLLSLLLDRYERSKHYAAPGESNRSISLRFDRATLPDYWDESRWQRRGELNHAAGALAALGLIRIQHARYSHEEIERVDLLLDRVEQAYAQANRSPRRAQEEALATVASSWAERWPADWRRTFVQSLVSAVDTFQRLPAGFKPGESELLDEICHVLDRLGPAGLSEEMPRRLFSQRVLGSSKRLESIQARVLRVLREFWPTPLPDVDAEALAEVGVLENPQQVLMAGPVSFQGLSVGAAGDAVGLPSSFVERSAIVALDAERVITVENLTSYYEVVSRLPPRTVAVYLGGYHSRPRRELLLKLDAARQPAFYHWGDIDLGGFRIFAHLQAKTGLPIRPLLMDVDTYLKHQANGMDFGDAYAKEIGALLDHAPFKPLHDTVRAMVSYRRRVEQESIPFRPMW